MAVRGTLQVVQRQEKQANEGATVIFIFPLILSFVAAYMFVVYESPVVIKAIVVAAVCAAAAMQFYPDLRSSVHFLIPLFMQLGICGWAYFAGFLE